ncbi:MAG: hypothetical protein BRC33_08495 [Cyanobacteria bacterium SW_9_44_58]|nr:MAG: hypothetical protein BRC33_08495 [Cyanobacteria bacterium SW_9_44_58]
MSRTIVFLSPMCLLDTRSGAAHTLRTLLIWLAEAGWHAYSISASLFDGNYEFAMATAVGEKLANPDHQGKFLQYTAAGVQHNILYTQSTIQKNLTTHEAKQLLVKANELLSAWQPDIVIGFGGSLLSKKLWEIARKYSRKLVFYLANASYEDSEVFEPFDHIICPSNFLRDLYRQRLGIQPEIFRNAIIEANAYAPREDVFPTNNIHLRKQGFITFINPSPRKGVTLALVLIQLAYQQRPDLTFLCLEGTITKEMWQRNDVHIAEMPNVWWLPNQRDMRRVYQRTSILLFPSFWPEASGRAVLEAQLGGIPVLATRNGGIPEQLNGGGFLFDVPAGCDETYLKIPPYEAVQPWFNTICRLMDDDQAYTEAVERATKAAEPFQPQQRKQEFLKRMEELAKSE